MEKIVLFFLAKLNNFLYDIVNSKLIVFLKNNTNNNKIKELLMAKKLLVNNCGECRHCDSVTLVPLEGYKRRCRIAYTDKQKTDWKTIPDWRFIPDWCPLEDY